MKLKTFLILLLLVTSCSNNATVNNRNEDYYNNRYSKLINGKREIRKDYSLFGVKQTVIIDIETKTEVIEGGLDKRSSLDSIQQALFFAFLTGKKPVVVIYDTDGELGAYEYRIQNACKLVGVEFRHITK